MRLEELEHARHPHLERVDVPGDELHARNPRASATWPATARRAGRIRNTDQPDEVICFGLFEGTAGQLRESADAGGYAEQMDRIAPYVDSVGADGLYEVVEELNPTR
jgi:hypothetical protein